VVLSARVKEREMAEKKRRLDDIAATERHNRLAKQIVSQIVNEPITGGGTMSDVMMLCEGVLLPTRQRCEGARAWRVALAD
jgi:hypothetical protein